MKKLLAALFLVVNIFSNIEFLSACPEHLSTIAKWQYNDWHDYDRSLTLAALIRDYEKHLVGEAVPFTLVALKEGRPIGAVSLTWNIEPEFADYPKYSLWAGGLHVIEEERYQGLACMLAERVLAEAKKLGHEQIYFYTSLQENVWRYCKRGAEVIERRPFRGHSVTLLKMSVDNRITH